VCVSVAELVWWCLLIALICESLHRVHMWVQFADTARANKQSFTGKLQSSGLYPHADDDRGESSPWLLTLHRGLGSMVEEGLGLSNSMRGSMSSTSAEPSSANGHGRKGLSTKRHKIDLGAGPKGATGEDEVEVAV